tara:strand:- start:1546 stop:1935 length:390 start_codon:yes stop_codon:yes gene_type:complete
MSSYPDAFRINCVGKLPCNTNYNACSDEPIVLENRKPIQESSTSHCRKYSPPRNVIQDNQVDFRVNNDRMWSNSHGYGNIKVSSNDKNNDIVGRVHPYNRIPALDNTNNNLSNHAWNNNKAEYKACSKK